MLGLTTNTPNSPTPIHSAWPMSNHRTFTLDIPQMNTVSSQYEPWSTDNPPLKRPHLARTPTFALGRNVPSYPSKSARNRTQSRGE